MKRRDLLRHLERHGCELMREGREHNVWVNREDARRIRTSAVPSSRCTQGPEEGANQARIHCSLALG